MHAVVEGVVGEVEFPVAVVVDAGGGAVGEFLPVGVVADEEEGGGVRSPFAEDPAGGGAVETVVEVAGGEGGERAGGSGEAIAEGGGVGGAAVEVREEGGEPWVVAELRGGWGRRGRGGGGGRLGGGDGFALGAGFGWCLAEFFGGRHGGRAVSVRPSGDGEGRNQVAVLERAEATGLGRGARADLARAVGGGLRGGGGGMGGAVSDSVTMSGRWSMSS